MAPGSKLLRVGANTSAAMDVDDFSDWEDEELIRGQKRNKKGQWAGRPPKVIPMKLLHELNRRVATKGVKMLNATLVPAIEYMCAVAAGRVPPDKDRMHACEVVINRVLGMTPQKVELLSIEETPYERAGVRKAVIIRDVLDVESTEEDAVSPDAEYDPFD